MGDAQESMCRRLFLDVFGCPVSRGASVDVYSEVMCFACRALTITCFVFQLLVLSDTMEDKIKNAHLSHKIWYSNG